MGVDVGLGHLVDRWRAPQVLLTLAGGWMGVCVVNGCWCWIIKETGVEKKHSSLTWVNGWVDGSVHSQWLLVLDHQGDRGGEETLSSLTGVNGWVGVCM